MKPGRPRLNPAPYPRLRILELLIDREKTMADLLAFVGVKQRAVDRWRAGDEPPTDDHKRRLLDFLQCDWWELSESPDPHLSAESEALLRAYKELEEPLRAAVRRVAGLRRSRKPRK